MENRKKIIKLLYKYTHNHRTLQSIIDTVLMRANIDKEKKYIGCDIIKKILLNLVLAIKQLHNKNIICKYLEPAFIIVNEDYSINLYVFRLDNINDEIKNISPKLSFKHDVYSFGRIIEFIYFIISPIEFRYKSILAHIINNTIRTSSDKMVSIDYIINKLRY